MKLRLEHQGLNHNFINDEVKGTTLRGGQRCQFIIGLPHDEEEG